VDLGFQNGANYALVSYLCNVLSGISVTIYKPSNLLKEPGESKCGSGAAFTNLIVDFFPPQPIEATKFAGELYDLARNTLSHSLGVLDDGSPKVLLKRTLRGSDLGVAWTNEQLNELECGHFQLPGPSIEIDGSVWTLRVERFYLDCLCLLKQLIADEDQMRAAENRLASGVTIWRLRP
jgi:hypothetical protein